MISDFYFKKLGKMIDDPDYDLNERFVPKLLDLGFIEEKRESYGYNGFHMMAHLDYSYYVVTKLGKKAYNDWKNG